MTKPPADWINPPIDWSEGGSSKAFKAYADAFVSLLNNAPKNHPDFVAIVEEGGRVKATQSNVALESGHPRSRISGSKSDFKKLAELIRSFRHSHGVAETTTKKLEERQERILELEQLVRVLHSRIAVMSIERHEMHEQMKEAQRDLAAARRK